MLPPKLIRLHVIQIRDLKIFENADADAKLRAEDRGNGTLGHGIIVPPVVALEEGVVGDETAVGFADEINAEGRPKIRPRKVSRICQFSRPKIIR